MIRSVAAIALLAGACVPGLPAFDCGRPGATCGDVPGAALRRGRCAEPAADCASGLRYAASAGELAGECVPPADLPDAGVDAPDEGPIVFESGQAADLVLGQGDFTGSSANAFGPAGASLSAPAGLCSDGARLLVADAGNHRVLVFDPIPEISGRTAAFAVGQPDLTTVTAGGGPSRLREPRAVACDAGRLVVADQGNHRALVWATVPAAAGAVPVVALGQADLDAATEGAGDRGVTSPGDGALAAGGGPVAVADTGNHRVLVWDAVPTSSGAPAMRVLGQADFNGTSPDRGGSPGARTLDVPAALLFHGGRLAVVETGNHRVLLHEAPYETGQGAASVVGQADFGATLANRGQAPAADSLNQPSGICAVGAGAAIVDTGNHRVLVFDAWPPTGAGTATAVLGQATFDGGGTGPATATRLRSPSACVYAGGALWVADTGNHRVVRYMPR